MMVEQLIKLLNSKDSINGWKIIEHKKDSYELYFIRRDLEMNRSKNILNLDVTVYKDFEEDGVKYKGSSLTQIHPTMTEVEVDEAIEEAIYASQFVKNQYYPLVKQQEKELGKVTSNLSEKPLEEYMTEIVDAVFKADNYEKGSINSTEIFLTKINERIINSEGIDESYEKYDGVLEFITNWKEEKEEIELYKHIDFGSFDSDTLTKEVNQMLELSKGRAIAEKTPSLGKANVILNGDSLAQFFSYYYRRSNTNYVHQKLSTAKIDESIQGENITGDKVSLKLNPFMKGSTFSASIDNDGVVLNEIDIIVDGVLKRYWGSERYSYYLDVETTGNIRNCEVKCGKNSIEELKQEPHLEVISFSSFQLDHFTGNLGGEIRFAWYFDGEKTIPVSGGSISANINEVQTNMLLSKEQIQINNYIGPSCIKMQDVVVAGNE